MSSTLSLPASLPNYTDDPNPLNSAKKANPHKYRSTKSFFSRILSSDLRIQDLNGSKGDPDQEQLKNSYGVTKHTYCEQEWAARRHLKSRTMGTHDCDQSYSSKRRILCPWNDDDPEMLRRFRKRVKSAPVVLNSPAIQHKPGLNLSRSRTTLSILSEFDLERSAMTSRKCQKFKQKTMPGRYMQVYIQHQENAKGTENDKTEERINNQMSRSTEQTGRIQTNKAEIRSSDLAWPQDQSGERSQYLLHSLPTIQRPTSTKAPSVEILESQNKEFKSAKSAFHNEISSVSVTKLAVQSCRLSGPKHYSPAGYLDTTEKFQNKPHKLPTILVNVCK